MGYCRLKVALCFAGGFSPNFSTPSGAVGVFKVAEQILVPGVCGGACGEPPAQLEPPYAKVGLQPEAEAGGGVLLPGGPRDGRHGPPGHSL